MNGSRRAARNGKVEAPFAHPDELPRDYNWSAGALQFLSGGYPPGDLLHLRRRPARDPLAVVVRALIGGWAPPVLFATRSPNRHCDLADVFDEGDQPPRERDVELPAQPITTLLPVSGGALLPAAGFVLTGENDGSGNEQQKTAPTPGRHP